VWGSCAQPATHQMLVTHTSRAESATTLLILVKSDAIDHYRVALKRP
jgi:hypothetical protein